MVKKELERILSRDEKIRMFIGIRLSRKIGKKLAEENPEILEEWKGGKSYAQLAQEYCREDYEMSRSVGVNAIYYCLRELSDRGKLTLEEIKYIAKEHMRKYGKINGKIGGLESFRLKTGCFGISPKKRKRVSRKVAKKLGERYGKENYRFLKEMSEEKKRGAIIKGMITRDQRLFSKDKKQSRLGYMDEKSYIIMLKESGKFSWKEIEDETNFVYNNNRRLTSIRTQYNSQWKHETIGRFLT